MDKNNESRKELYTPEAKRERFKRVAERRTNRILSDLRMLGNTSNKSLYSYTRADVDKIFNAIEIRKTEIRAKFKTADHDSFTLDS